MEFINDLGPVGKFMHASNPSAFRYMNYYFDEHLTETQLYDNVHLMVNTKDNIPSETTCLLINVKISFERLNQILCESNITSVVFYKDMFVENIDTSAVCRNIQTVVCYNIVSLNMLNRFFPNLRYIYMFRQNETINGKRVVRQVPMYTFENLEELHIYSSGSLFQFTAPHLEKLSVYSSYESWTLDVNKYPKLTTLRIDVKINVTNLNRKWKVLQFFPSKGVTNSIDLRKVSADDLLLPPTSYMYDMANNKAKVLGLYVNTEKPSIDVVRLQVYDPVYPLKMCSLRFNNQFYKYFPFADEVNSSLIERFNIQKQRENLLMIFNFDFMNNASDEWLEWYNACIEIYHRIPIIMQNGQLMLNDGGVDKEKIWPNTVNKIRKECVIFLPEEELIYINCSPMRLQTLVDKLMSYRRQKFIISKLWLVTNGFEIATKDIEERVNNLVIVNNQVKMYVNF